MYLRQTNKILTFFVEKYVANKIDLPPPPPFTVNGTFFSIDTDWRIEELKQYSYEILGGIYVVVRVHTNNGRLYVQRALLVWKDRACT